MRSGCGRRVAGLLAAALALTPGFGATNPPEKDERILLRIATVATEGSPWLQGLQDLCARLEKNSGGRVRCRVFGGAVRGDEIGQVKAVLDGELEGFAGSVGGLVPTVPEIAVLELPFLFETEEEADRVLEVVRPRIAAILKKHGFQFMAMSEVGFRSLASTKPIQKLDDLTGLRVRSMENPIHADMWKRFGALPVQLGITHVLGALEEGRVHGADHAPSYAFGASWFQPARNFLLTRHMYQPGLFVVSTRFYEKLPRPVQKHFSDGFDELAQIMRQRVRALNREVLGMLPSAGVSVRAIDPAVREQLMQRARPLREQFRKSQSRAGRELLEAVESELARLRLRH